MVESIMIFALGFIAAALIALVVIPAINARADRLARRRAEALFPLSISELTAEKDHLRAEFAILQRRLERKAEEAMAVKHQSMEELGRRAVRIEMLTTDVAERDGVIQGLQADLADTRSRLAGTEDELAATKAALLGTRETLAAVENAHRKTLDELASTRAEFDRTSMALAGTRTELATTQDRLAAREAELADLEGRHNAALNDLDAKRITISDLETRLATQTARGDEFERTLSDRRGELSDERRRLADLAKNLLAEQERGMMLESRIRELEGDLERRLSDSTALTDRLSAASTDGETLRTSLDAGTERTGELERALDEARARIALLEAQAGSEGAPAPDQRSLADRVESLRAEKSALEGALAAAREERSRIEKELRTLRRSHADPESVSAENAELRRLITEVADTVLQAADSGGTAGEERRKAAV